MRWQRNMSQMKEQDKTPEKQPSEEEIGNRPENDSEDDLRSLKKNGGTD